MFPELDIWGILPLIIFPDVPSNLIANTVVADDGSGIVEVTATADNVTEYHFFMGDQLDDQPIININGKHFYKVEISISLYVIA